MQIIFLLSAGFDGDFVLHVKTNSTICQMVFTSADLKNAKDNIKFQLWRVDSCAFHGFVHHQIVNDKMEPKFQQFSKDKTDSNYQGEAAFSSDGAEVAFVQTTPLESK
jgi:hypothetical protein